MELEIVVLDLAGDTEAASLIPVESFVVLCPHVRPDGLAVPRRGAVGGGGGDDFFQAGSSESKRAVRRKEDQ